MRWLILILCICIFKKVFSEENISAAYLVAHQIKNSLDSQESKYISALIHGMRDREKGVILSSTEQQAYSNYIKEQRKTLSQHNLVEVEDQFRSLQANRQISWIFPSKLAYSIVKEGRGNLLKKEHRKVLVHYIVKKLGSIFPEITEKNKEINLSETIPGFSLGILSMQEGEVRTIYMHPELTYHEDDNFDPNTGLEITVELLKILPSIALTNQSEIFSSNQPIKISTNNPDNLDHLQLKEAYVFGWKLWDHLRWGYKLFNQEEVIAALQKDNLENLSSDYDQEINKIHWRIYHQRINDEYQAAEDYLRGLATQPNIKCLAPGYLYCYTKKIKEKPSSQTDFKAEVSVKDRNGVVLLKQSSQVFQLNNVIRGLKESLPYLIPGEQTTLFIHPKWAYLGVDGPLGDILVIIDLVIMKA